MKRIIFTTALLSLLLLCGGVARGQETTSSQGELTRHHEVGFSYGCLPMSIFSLYPHSMDFWSDGWDEVSGSFKAKPWVNCLNFHYSYHFNRFHSIIVTGNWFIMQHGNHSYTWTPLLKHHHLLGLQVGYGITYFTKGIVSLYSTANVGFIVDLGTPQVGIPNHLVQGLRKDIWPEFHVCLLGVRLGKSNAANFELGFGTQGMLKMGYNYKF